MYGISLNPSSVKKLFDKQIKEKKGEEKVDVDDLVGFPPSNGEAAPSHLFLKEEMKIMGVLLQIMNDDGSKPNLSLFCSFFANSILKIMNFPQL